MAEHLGLSEEQRATWKSLYEQHRTEMEPLRQEGRDLHERLARALDATSPDPTAVGLATIAMKQHRDKIKAADEAFQTRLTGTLSEEQKTKFEALKAANRGGHGQGFSGHRGPKPGGADESSSAPSGPVEG